MFYASGEEAHLGDRVRLGENPAYEGVVVFSLDSGEFSDRFARSDWEYLGGGVLIEFQGLGLIHYTVAEPGLVLMARRRSSSAL